MRQALLVFTLLLSGASAAASPHTNAEEVQAQAAESFPELDKLLKERNFDAALIVAKGLTRAHPDSALAFFLLGRTQFYREDDNAARDALGKAIALQSDYAEAYFFRGLTYNYGAHREQGKADFEKATQLKPSEAKYWHELGRVHERAGRSDAAVRAFDTTVKLDPRNASAWFALGNLASGKHEHALAESMWEKTLTFDPEHVEAHFNLGIHHQLRGDASISLAHFLATVRHRPNDSDVLKKLVQAYYRLEDFANAAVYRQKFLDTISKSKDPAVRDIKEFCVDQFDAPGGRFFVYETLDKDAPLVYWYTFKLADSNGNTLKTINLERSAVLIEQGTQFILGQNEGDVHSNYGIAYKQMPPYLQLKDLVLQANAGKLRVAASSDYSKKTIQLLIK